MPLSPALPWEVIERVIDHSTKNTQTLYSFTLTCRNVRPHSTIVLLGRVKLQTRDQLFDLCAVLEANPHLKPCVRSVSMRPHEFSPHPLLRILPNLSEIEFRKDLDYTGDKRRPVVFHPTVLRCCRQLGQAIQTLSLRDLHFSSLSAFSEILLLFPRIRSLSCDELQVKDDSIHREFTTRRLSEQLRSLSSLIIGRYINDTLLILLRESAKDRITTLAVEHSYVGNSTFDKFLLASSSDWARLGSFKWRLGPYNNAHDFSAGVEHVLRIFNDFRPANLQGVTVDFSFYSFQDLLFKLLPFAAKKCAELETTLLTFPKPTLSFSPWSNMNGRRYHSWMPILSKFFPALAERRALMMNAEHSGQAGHDGSISTPIVISTDSQWAATGSKDGTIIVWDSQTGCIARDWLAEDTGVQSIAFSPDGRYLLSASSEAAAKGEGATIWDLRVHQGGRTGRVNTPTKEDEYRWRYGNINCAWSPDGSWIAAGPQNDGAIHIWETTTFQRRHHAWPGKLLAFSAEKSWIVTGANPSLRHLDSRICWIWNIESGNLHRSLHGHTGSIRAAALNSGSTRIATGSVDSTVRIWDTETGEQLLVLGDLATSKRIVDAVAFSGDGRMVLSHSYLPEYGDDEDDDYSGGAKVWDASSGTLLASLSGTRADFRSTSHSACFSPCGSFVASASDNTEATLWRTSDWSCIASVSGGGVEVTHVAISPNGRMLCWGTKDGRVFFRRMHDLISGSRD